MTWGFEEGRNHIYMRQTRRALWKQWQSFENLGKLFSSTDGLRLLVPNNGRLGCLESHFYRKQVKILDKIFF